MSVTFDSMAASASGERERDDPPAMLPGQLSQNLPGQSMPSRSASYAPQDDVPLLQYHDSQSVHDDSVSGESGLDDQHSRPRLRRSRSRTVGYGKTKSDPSAANLKKSLFMAWDLDGNKQLGRHELREPGRVNNTRGRKTLPTSTHRSPPYNCDKSVRYPQVSLAMYTTMSTHANNIMMARQVGVALVPS